MTFFFYNALMMNLPIDHVLYGVPELEQGIKEVFELTGVMPIIGGSHPGLGTRNALLGLGNNIYMEIIAPDPRQQVKQVWMNLDRLRSPRLFRWAAYSDQLQLIKKRALSNAIDIGDIRKGSRNTPEGNQLSWHLSDPNVILGDGIVPFFIDWGPQGNPSDSLPQGCVLTSFSANHPNPVYIQNQLALLGIDMQISPGKLPGLVLEMTTPKGSVSLR